MSGPVPGLVATDLDGTLVRPDGSVSARTRTTLARLAERGVPVVLVTARPIRWMDDLWPLVGGTTVGIVSNGAVLYDVPARRVARVVGIDRDPGLAMLADLRAAVPEAAYAVECLAGLRADPRFDEPAPGAGHRRRRPRPAVERASGQGAGARGDGRAGGAGGQDRRGRGHRGHRLVDDARPGRGRPTGRDQGGRTRRGAPGWACPPVRWWRSATCPTTWRC
ncbi:MAG: HAD-IIB family hydrolase [Nocardioides sp.]